MFIKLKRLHIYLKKLPIYKLIALFVVVNVLLSISFSLISFFVFKKHILENFMQFDNVYEEYFATLVFAPLLETALFQALPFYLTAKYLPAPIIIILSGAIFGALHNYNPIYMAATFLSGCQLSYLYFLKGCNTKAYFITTLAHFTYNAVALFIDKL